MASFQFLEVLTSTELYKLSAWEQFTQKHSKVGEIRSAGQNSVEYGTVQFRGGKSCAPWAKGAEKERSAAANEQPILPERPSGATGSLLYVSTFLNGHFYAENNKSRRLVSSVADPDPDPVGSVYYWLFWIRIRIRILYTDPDPTT